jgi:hypothetical protein
MPCYNGPLPVKDDERIAIWRWAKANGIDHGLPIEKVGDAINQKFFNGMAKSEWITDILSGRKTPFRELSNAAWKQQYNRRQIIQQAKDLASRQAPSPVAGTLQKIWNIPRSAAVFGHGLVFPVTHAGDLALRPQSWGVFMRGFLNTWTKSWSPAAAERMMDSMKRQPLFDTALRSGLDVGERATRGDLVTQTGKGSTSERAWSALTAMRYELWDHEMQKYVKPGMSQAQVLDIGRNLAEWANHATGSANGPLSSSKFGRQWSGALVFGPKLTESKISRLVADPLKTAGTFANWGNATAGEKATAWTRLSGATQYLVTGATLLAVNQGVLWATGQKDKNGKPVQINFNDPRSSDFLAFKVGGLEWSLPGMHSEFKYLGQMLAAAFMSNEEANKFSHGLGKQALWQELIGKYAMSKVNPTIGLGIEAAAGHDYMGRPLPWVHDKKVKANKPQYSWLEYALSHGPIPLTGPIKYVYDQLRTKGASALDATGIIKGLIITGVGLTGVHIGEDYGPAVKAAAKRAHIANQLQVGR